MSADHEKRLLIDAIELTLRSQTSVNAGGFQRQLRVGFATASRLLTQLEALGVVGPCDTSGIRPILVSLPVGSDGLPDALAKAALVHKLASTQSGEGV